ncbi:hypothetical protein SLEP1_g60279, partial [Rubroshorea leprosula]
FCNGNKILMECDW